MWERYCRGVNAIVYMVDAADLDKIEASRNELHNLLEKPQVRKDLHSVYLKIQVRIIPICISVSGDPDLGAWQQAGPAWRPRRERAHREDEPERHSGQGDLLLLRLVQGERQY